MTLILCLILLVIVSAPIAQAFSFIINKLSTKIFGNINRDEHTKN